MSELTQETFLGCSVRSFNFNIGWGGSSSALSVDLVEDDALFQRMGLLTETTGQHHYVDPIGLIGQLARFDYSGWVYDGIISNVDEKKSDSGNRVWTVNMTDPREFLDGVQLILSGYSGGIYSVPNIYNIYGYLESISFGNSENNEAGTPWKKVVDTMSTLVNITPLKLAGVPLFIDLSTLPRLPEYYRIATNNISLLTLINEICETANFDFTCILLGNTIKIVTVDRNTGYLNGAISRFLQSIDGNYVELSSGYELQHTVTNKFLVGAPVEQIHYQENSVGPDQIVDGKSFNPTYDDTISRFWGLDANGNVITATRATYKGCSNYHNANEEFIVDGKPISYPGIPWYEYPMDVMELRAAIKGQGEWANFLQIHDDGQLAPIHKDKAKRLKLGVDMNHLNLQNTKEIQKTSIADVVRFDAVKNLSDQHHSYIEKVYRFVNSYATQYMGVKYMVKIPFVYSKRDEDTGEILNSLEPAESGYFEEAVYQQAVAQGLMPDFTDFVTTPEGKIEAYVRFGPFTVEELNLSNISEDDYYISGQYVFVKCDVDEKIVFLDKETRYSPRVVITLRGPVLLSNEHDILNMLCQAYVNEFIIDTLVTNGTASRRDRVTAQQVQDYIDDAANVQTIKDKKKEFDTWKKQCGAEYAFMTKEDVSLIPSLAAIPLRSNINTYGPWYSDGYEGKVEFEQNFEMNPWTFGGFENMNRAGNAIVSSIQTNSMIGESGSISVPGVPAMQPATQLVTGGPMISQIDVAIGDQGVVTTYRFGKWNVTHGKQITENIENFKKIYNLKKEQARAFRALFKPKPPIDALHFRAGGSMRNLPPPRRIKAATTHSMIVSTLYDRVEENRKGNNIGSVPYYHIGNIADGEWEKIAGCSMDGLFRPFSTDYNASGIPHFSDPSGYTGSDPTVADLNPYKAGHDIKTVFRGASGTVPINNSGYGPEDTYRGIAFKGPLIIAGYGYDTSGKPVPNSNPDSPGSSFLDKYLERQEEWPCGPVDIRWDTNRKVWVASGGSKMYFYTLTTDMGESGGSGIIRTKTGTEITRSGWIVNTLRMFDDQTTGAGGVCESDDGTNFYALAAPCNVFFASGVYPT